MEQLIKKEIANPASILNEFQELNETLFLLEEEKKEKKAALDNYYRSSDLHASPLEDKEEQEKFNTISRQFSLFPPISVESKQEEQEKRLPKYVINNNTLDLSAQYIINKDVFDSIVPFLKEHPEITTLNMKHNNIHGEDVIRALINISTLRSLDLSHGPIGDEEVEILAQSPYLTSLNVSKCKIDNDEGIIALSKNTTLTSLDVSYNYINEEGIEALANNTTLQSLKLINCGLTLEEVTLLAENTTLSSLDLSRNTKIGNKGAQILANNQTLTTLILQFCEIHGEGAKDLAKNITLRELDLGGNPIRSTGVLALANNTHLRILKLSNATIGGTQQLCETKTPRIGGGYTTLWRWTTDEKSFIDSGAAEALKNNKTLRLLDLSYTKLNSAEVTILAKNSTLISLDVSHNNIGDVGAAALANNKTLKDLYICGDRFKSTGIGVAGIQALAKNKTLLMLDLEGNNIDFAGKTLFIGVKVTLKSYVKCPDNLKGDEDCDEHDYLDYREVKTSDDGVKRIRKAAGLTSEKKIAQVISIENGDKKLLIGETIKAVAPTPKRPCTP